MTEAARLGDPIGHSGALAGFLAGALIGASLIAAVGFLIVTGGLGGGLLVGLVAGLGAALGATALLALGESVGQGFASMSGAITSGSPNVFIDGRPAARAVASDVRCARHNPTQRVAEGSGNVFINGWPAARRGDRSTCGARVDAGSPDVFIGGGTVLALPVEDEVPSGLRTAVDAAFTLAGLVGGLAGLVRVAGGFSRALLPCLAKFTAGFAVGEAVGRYVLPPVVRRVYGGLFGHPVDMTTGRKVLLADDETDAVVQSTLPVVLARFYASDLALRDASLGPGWMLPWEVRLERRDGRIWHTDAQGRESGFPDLRPGEAAFSPTEQRVLSRTACGRWIVHDQAETCAEFGPLEPHEGAVALLRRTENLTGHWQCFERDADGRLVRLHTSGGQEVLLSYRHPEGRLTSVHGGAGTSGHALVRYAYDAGGRLSGVTDANGRVVRRFTYDARGPMVRHVGALGFACSYDWAEIGGRLRVVSSRTGDGAGPGEHVVYRHDPRRRRSRVRDALGRSAQWEWDEHHQIVRATDLDGRRYGASYDPHGHPVELTLPGSRTIRFERDAAGRVVAETDPLGRVTRTLYDGNGLRVAERTTPDGGRWRARYDLQGRLRETVDAIGRVERFDHAPAASPGFPGAAASPTGPATRPESAPTLPAAGPTTHTDALGRRRHMRWAARGVLLSETDCTGRTTTHAHDADGRWCGSTVALSPRKPVSDNPAGSPSEADAAPPGQRLQTVRSRLVHGPTGEVTSLIRADGTRESFEHDALGLLVKHVDAAGRVHRWVRDARGQVTEAIDPMGHNLSCRYDAQGRRIELSSDHGARYRFAYDAGDRLASEMRPDGVTRHFRYDAAGWLREVITVGAPEPALHPASGATPPRRRVLLEHDPVGRLTARITATATTRYAWDAADRLVQAERTPTAEGVRLGVQPDTVRRELDGAGRLVAEHGANGRVACDWDDLDHLLTLHLPAGPSLERLAYGAGHVHQLQVGDRVVTDIERDALHREVQRSQGALTHRTGHDALGRRAWQTANPATEPSRTAGTGAPPPAPGAEPGVLTWTYQYSPAGELEAVTDSLRGTIQCAHDPAGRLLRQTRAGSARDEHFAWDAGGNLVDTEADNRRANQERPDKVPRAASLADNRLRAWRDLRFTHDPWGNVVEKRCGDRQHQAFTFDADDRLLAVMTREGGRGCVQTRFAYDALGRRTARTEIRFDTLGVPGRTEHRHFVWQGLRMVQELRDGSASTYVYSPDAPYTPLARVDVMTDPTRAPAPGDNPPAPTSQQLYHFHTDPAGMPLALTDEAGRLAWAGRHGAWGKVDHGEAVLPTPRTEQPLRYAGQYADEATGLHYNTFRYYDPDTGRYLSPDPIGLAGGSPNLYAYAPNPTRWTDPWGWCATPVGKKTGAAKTVDELEGHPLAPEEVLARVGRGKIPRPNLARNGINDGTISGRVQAAERGAVGNVAIDAARADQLRWGYASDDWGTIQLEAGRKIYGGLPGQSAYYTDNATLEAARGSRTSLFESLQVAPHPEFGYRPMIGEYEVVKDATVPFETVRANPEYGAGGGNQFFIDDYSTNLRLIRKISLGQ